MLTGIAFLIGATLLGIGLVRRLPPLRLWLNHVEQAAWGMVVGWMLTTLGAYLIARVLGRLSFRPMLALTIAVWIIAAVLWLELLRRIRREGLMVTTLWRPEYAGLALVVTLFAPIYLRLFSTHMLEPGVEGVYSGGSAWFDLPFHLAISTSFVYGQNFPPIYTPFPPESLFYPFMPDFLTAALVSLGMSFRWALLSTSVPLAFVITGLFYSLAVRILKNFGTQPALIVNTESQTLESAEMEVLGVTHRPEASRFTRLPLSSAINYASASAVLATVLFLLNGGLGFLYFLEDWRKSHKSLGEFLSHLTTNYGNMGEKYIHWTNLISDTLLPQRTSLFGIPVALMAFTIFVLVWLRWFENESKRPWDGWQLLLPAGVVVGLLPAFHTHTYLAIGLVSVCLFLLRPRRAWLAFWVPAVLLAVPHLLSLRSHVSPASFMRFQPGWRGHGEASWLLYWLRNIGVPLLIIVPAWWQAPRHWRRFYLAFVALMVFSLIVVVSPFDYDNIKLMFYWYAISSVLIAAWLMRLATVHRQRFLTFLLIMGSIATALLALQFERVDKRLLFSGDGMDAASEARLRTKPRALFLTAPMNHQPILSLAGRPVLRGLDPWLISHGYEFQQREADVRAIYAGAAEARALLEYYRVSFVYVSLDEKYKFQLNQRFFDENFPIFYRNASLTIYDTQALAEVGGDDSALLPAAVAPREFASRLDKDPYQLLIEFPRVGYALYRYYRVAYGRMPKYQEFMADMQRISRDIYVSAPGWQELLEQNKQKLTDEWLNRDDFKTLYDAKTDEEYVNALHANVGIASSASEREPLLTTLRTGTETRAAVLRRVAENRELRRREYNSAYVLMHYFGYLRRNPDDPPDNNWVGFNFWLGDLNSARDYRNLSGAFLSSGEYEARCRAMFGANESDSNGQR